MSAILPHIVLFLGGLTSRCKLPRPPRGAHATKSCLLAPHIYLGLCQSTEPVRYAFIAIKNVILAADFPANAKHLYNICTMLDHLMVCVNWVGLVWRRDSVAVDTVCERNGYLSHNNRRMTGDENENFALGCLQLEVCVWSHIFME